MATNYLLERWRRGHRILASRLDNMVLAIDAANTWHVTGAARYQISPHGHMLHVEGGGAGAAACFPAHITAWNAGTTDYDWSEVRRNSADTAWETWADNRNSTDFNNARHVEGWQSLPCNGSLPIFVMMTFTVDADGDTQPFFTVPVQRDGTFAHRTTAGGAPTLGDREDRSKTEAELKQATGTFEPQTNFGIESQAAGKHGWVVTVVNGTGYDTTAHDQIIQFKDVEYDVMGRFVSESKTFETQLIDYEAC